LERATIDSEDGCLLSLKVIPKSSRNHIVSVEQGVVKLKLQAPPFEGVANEAVLWFLSKSLKRPKSSLTLVTGHHSRYKQVKIQGMKSGDVLEILNSIVKGNENGRTV